jgi:WD40 repeat protein
LSTDTLNRTYLATFEVHTNVTTQFIYLDDKLVSSGADGNVRIWQWEDGRLVSTLAAHEKAVRGMAWTKDSFVTGGMDGKVRLWNRNDSQPLFDIREPVSAVWQLVAGYGKLAVALRIAQGKHLVEIWDLAQLRSRT